MQGSFEEHLQKLAELKQKIAQKKVSLSGINSISLLKVKTPEDLEKVDALILPGGESTTIGKLIRIFGLFEPLKKRIQAGLPVWGTCCGMILLAKEVYLYVSVDGKEEPHLEQSSSHLSVMDISVLRNSWGSQLHSFTSNVSVPLVSLNPMPLVFIRGPCVRSVLPSVSAETPEILARLDSQIVAVRQKNMLATSFHPELISGTEFYEYFLNM